MCWQQQQQRRRQHEHTFHQMWASSSSSGSATASADCTGGCLVQWLVSTLCLLCAAADIVVVLCCAVVLLASPPTSAPRATSATCRRHPRCTASCAHHVRPGLGLLQLLCLRLPLIQIMSGCNACCAVTSAVLLAALHQRQAASALLCESYPAVFLLQLRRPRRPASASTSPVHWSARTHQQPPGTAAAVARPTRCRMA